MVTSKFTPDQKIQIVLESIKTNIGTAELCRKHNLHPHTFSTWKERFVESGKAGLRTRKNDSKAFQKEREGLKSIIAEQAIAIDVLKKTLEGSRN